MNFSHVPEDVKKHWSPHSLPVLVIHSPSFIIPIPTSQSSEALFPGSYPKSTAAIMVRAFKVHELDGLEILMWEGTEIRESNEGEICVKNQAIEFSFIDICPDKGVCRAATIPFTPSMKAVRMVTAVGSQR
ncbi:hypothetical protein CK203_004087 [Vitis vinifera]|uniref:Uncharacterized protein n=1 Tax=Vitis vinifera TaxID=29760 RepID=A0A438K9E1_VITVI|nr:hypothetical protein CK203_004087 [Vitis vinifera]